MLVVLFLFKKKEDRLFAFPFPPARKFSVMLLLAYSGKNLHFFNYFKRRFNTDSSIVFRSYA
jgi:hypothetical protein